MRRFLQDLFVPFFVLSVCTIYWLSLDGAPSISKRIPVGVIYLILVLSAAIILQAAINLRKLKNEEKSGLHSFDGLLVSWWRDWHKRLILIGLSITYYFAFNNLGFSLANFLFLMAAFVTAGFAKGKGTLAAIGKTLSSAFIASAIFYWLAIIMEFNVPRAPFGL